MRDFEWTLSETKRRIKRTKERIADTDKLIAELSQSIWSCPCEDAMAPPLQSPSELGAKQEGPEDKQPQ